MFLICDTQWKTGGISGAATGFDYAGVRAAAAMAGIEVPPERFEGLRAMEMAALDEMHKRR